MNIKLENSYRELGSAFSSRAEPEKLENPSLLHWNQGLAAELNIPPMTEKEQVDFFSGQNLPSSVSPIALAYAGHQFGHFNPELGDGRACLLGEWRDSDNHLWDLQLKGSGPTRFSRRGDGLSSLGPVVREYLVSEAMHVLGVPTTRALSAIRTGEAVIREESLPGGILCRVAPSHIRVGSFEYFAGRNDISSLKKLYRYTIDRHYPHLSEASSSETVLTFFQEFCDRQAKLVAQWMSLGFIHGVMNTDNTSIAGITIDYGPCAFMDQFQRSKRFSAIDDQGRYSYENQEPIARWNAFALANCLVPIFENQQTAIKALETELGVFPKTFKKYQRYFFARKFGLGPSLPPVKVDQMITEFFKLMEDEKLDFTLSFLELTHRLSGKKTLESKAFDGFYSNWKHSLEESYLSQDFAQKTKQLMSKTNPIVIPRNHLIESVIQQAIKGEDGGVAELFEVFKSPFDQKWHNTLYSRAPTKDEIVHRTFCGT